MGQRVQMSECIMIGCGCFYQVASLIALMTLVRLESLNCTKVSVIGARAL